MSLLINDKLRKIRQKQKQQAKAQKSNLKFVAYHFAYKKRG